jgi:hypothetical protein
VRLSACAGAHQTNKSPSKDFARLCCRRQLLTRCGLKQSKILYMVAVQLFLFNVPIYCFNLLIGSHF